MIDERSLRKKASSGPIAVQAISGSYVVLLGINMEEAKSKDVLGFAIERTDHTEDECYWLKGFKTFKETDPGLPLGSSVSTLEHPVQGFLWGDFTAKPAHDYTFKVVAMRGKPKKLDQGEAVEVRVETEDEDIGAQAVYFNRGVAGSQAYAREFGNKPPDEVPDGKAWTWLSRGLLEALLKFIGQANSNAYSLRGAFYEFQYQPVLKAFDEARKAGADVEIVFDARKNAKNYPNKKNRDAIAKAAIKDLVKPRESNPSYISHNKFIVLLKNGNPIQVWTGSTNITDGGIFGHSNVGHIVRDPNIAAKYLSYWDILSQDPSAGALRSWTEENTPVPSGMPEKDSVIAIFSPRPSLEALKWYAERMNETREAVFFTSAFGVNELLANVLAQEKDYLRYVLLESKGDNIQMLSRDKDTRIAVGSVLETNAFDRWLKERTILGLNTHIKYIHTKYMLIDPLSDDPLVITGSANFSDASTTDNDENMLVIRGNKRVADIYLGEFMRLFNHFYFRFATSKATASTSPDIGHLKSDSSWRDAYYVEGSPKQKERLYFAG